MNWKSSANWIVEGTQRYPFLTELSKRKVFKPSEMIPQPIDRDVWIQLSRSVNVVRYDT